MGSASPSDAVALAVKAIIISVLELQLDAADLDSGLSLYSDEIRMDSLSLLHIITRCEQDLSCEIDDEAMMSSRLVDVASLVDLVRRHLSSGSAVDGAVQGVVAADRGPRR